MSVLTLVLFSVAFVLSFAYLWMVLDCRPSDYPPHDG